MFVKKVTQIRKKRIAEGKNTFRQILISPMEAPNFAMRKFIIEPGGFMPLHTNTVEHEQYILGGKAKVQIGDEKLVVQKDDIVYIPKGVKHKYNTVGESPFEFLCIVPNKKDNIQLIEHSEAS